jgi:hypothetical protein
VKQVVNGMMYDMNLAVAISPCRNKYTMADPKGAEPEGHPCEKNYRVGNVQPVHTRVLVTPGQKNPYTVTFDDFDLLS